MGPRLTSVNHPPSGLGIAELADFGRTLLFQILVVLKMVG